MFLFGLDYHRLRKMVHQALHQVVAILPTRLKETKGQPEGSAFPRARICTRSRQRSRLCDRVLHGSERFSVTNSDVDRLQSTDTNGAFGEVGVGVNQDLQLAEHADQQVCKVPVNDSRQVGP